MAAAYRTEEPAPSGGRARLRRVLLVDDDPLVRRALASILQLDAEVVTASDRRTALGMLEQSRFDAIICDHDLPDGTGFDVLETWARAGRPASRFVLHTGRRDIDPAEVRVVLKPSDPSVFRSFLREVAEGT